MPFRSSDVARGLRDRYRFERELGAGGMATVYLADDLRHGRSVAIKVLRPELAAVLGRDRFLQEIQLAAQLQHPHILALIDSGEVEGALYYIMPYVAGETLRDWLVRDARLSLPDAARVTTQIADALGFAHRRGVIHRDIKPENILIQEGHALVADFGIALAVRQAGDQRLTQTGFSLGTPAYMSPEQLTGTQEIDGRSDQYSLACMVYEMVAGVPPFVGPNPHAVMVKHATESAPRLEAPAPVADAVTRALSKDPAHRFASVGKFGDAVSRVSTPARSGPVSIAGPVTVAVLPFANRSPDPDTEYFSDGLTDEVISDLSKVRAIRVISRISSSRYKSTTKDVRTIARELGVRYVASGTVRRAGDSLRVTAEVVDSETDTPIWSEKLAGTMADVFEVQERLSRQIVEALRVTVAPDESRRIAARPMENLRAYDCYLKARFAIWKWDPTALDAARAMVYEAMSAIGENALLHATLALVQWMSGSLGVELDESSIAIGLAHADRAIALDPELAAGYAAKGFMASKLGRGGVRTAISLVRRSLAIERNPDALICLAFFLAESGADSEAIAVGEEAALVDPLNFMAISARVLALAFSGDRAGVEAVAGVISDADPGNYVAWASEAAMLLMAGNVTQAKDRLRQSEALMPLAVADLPLARVCRAMARAAHGDQVAVSALLDRVTLECLGSDETYCCWGVWIFALIDDRTRVLEWLDRAIERGVVNDRWWGERDLLLIPYRSDPEFQTLIAKARRIRESEPSSP